MASVGAAAYLLARPPLELWPSFAELTADYRTGVGERRQVTLSDDISVEMNTRTSVVVPRTGMQAIELISGEIAVTTGSGPSTPSRSVSIIAGNGRTSGSRAAFDVRYDGGKAFAACFEGEILVECGGARATLKARQQIAYADAGLSDIVSTDGRAIAAWREGLLVFENQPLSQVISEINRYRRGRIILMNEDVGRLPLDATFRLDRIDEIVPEISHLFDLKIRALPGGVVLLG
jgi:transmembrane sensor